MIRNISDSHILAVYFVLASLSLSLNNFIGLPSGISLTQPFVLLIIFVFLTKFMNKGLPINDLILANVMMFFLVFCLFYQAINHSEFTLVKQLLYFLFAFSIANYKTNDKGEIIINAVLYVSLVFAVFAFVNSLYYIMSGAARIGLSSSLIFVKQEFTVVFSIFIGYFSFKISKSRVSKLDYLVFFLVIFSSLLIPIKSIFFVFSVILVFSFRKKFMTWYGFLTVFILLPLFLFLFTPESLSVLIKYYVYNEYLDKEVFRKLDTFIIREVIIVENIKGLTNSVGTFIFGSGFNFTEGMVYQSESGWYEQDLGLAFESGILFFLVNFGFLGSFMMFYLVIRIFRTPEITLYQYLFLAFLVSNIFQDNVGSMFWFLFGLAWSDKIRFNSNYIRDIAGGSVAKG